MVVEWAGHDPAIVAGSILKGSAVTCRKLLALVLSVALALAVTLGSLALSACGDKQASSYAGYWQGTSGGAEGAVLRIDKNGDTYEVSGFGDTPLPVKMENGKLTGQAQIMGPQPTTLSFALSDDGTTLTVDALDASGQSLGGAVTLTRAGGDKAALAARLEQQKNKAKDTAVKEGVHSLQVGIMTWAVDHNDTYPSVDMVVGTDKGFAKYLDSWPVNPFTGVPMKPGTQPGDYTYATDGKTFTLAGHLGDGSDFTVP